MKVEIESIKKTQNEEILEMKSLWIRTGSTEVNFTNRIQKMEDRVSDAEDMTENMDTSVKENVKFKILPT